MYEMKKGDATLIVELARGAAKGAAAATAGVHPSTVLTRNKDPEFRRLVSAQRRLFLDESAGILAEASTYASELLLEICMDEDEDAPVRRMAARDILDFTMRMRENMEVEDRLQEIEFLLEKELRSESSYD